MCCGGFLGCRELSYPQANLIEVLAVKRQKFQQKYAIP